MLVEIGREINRELKTYSKDPMNIYKYRGDLDKLANFRNEHLIKDIQAEVDNGMEVCTIDFSKEAVSNCANFSEPIYISCKQMLPESAVDLFEDTDIASALNALKEETLPKFR